MKNNKNNQLFFSMTLQYLETYLPRQLGRSRETIRSYTDSLSLFRRYLYENKVSANAPGTCSLSTFPG